MATSSWTAYAEVTTATETVVTTPGTSSWTAYAQATTYAGPFFLKQDGVGGWEVAGGVYLRPDGAGGWEI